MNGDDPAVHVVMTCFAKPGIKQYLVERLLIGKGADGIDETVKAVLLSRYLTTLLGNRNF